MKRSRIKFLMAAAIAISVLLIGGLTIRTGEASEKAEWPYHGGTPQEQQFSPLDKINVNTVPRLGLAWSFEFDSNRGQEATPIVIDDTMYVSTAWSRVYALRASTGRFLWGYDPHVSGRQAFNACCDVVNRGVAVANGRVFVGTIDGRLIALEARTGKVLWSTQTTDPKIPYSITGAPRVIRDKVIIGNGGADFGVRGYVTAYDVASGKQIWRFYTVPGDPHAGPDHAASDAVLKRIALPTWSGDWYNYGGGGTVWDSIVYDSELDQVYIGVGNGSPWNRVIRSAGTGDNLFLSSIVALDPDTGAYKWHFQETPGESWDFTATQPIILADLRINGQIRKVLMQAPKNGFFYVIDRTNGKLISAKNFVPVNWAKGIDQNTGRPLENPKARYVKSEFLMSPSSGGGHDWYPMSFDPQTGLVYIPAEETAMLYVNDKSFKYERGNINTGTDLSRLAPPDDPAALRKMAQSTKGFLIAWDPVLQAARWSAVQDSLLGGGVLSTAGALVFQGTGSGIFSARNAQTGKMLWSFPTHNTIMAGPISFEENGIQYVAIVIGDGGGFGLSVPAPEPTKHPNGRVLVFALGGHAKLPSFDPRITTPPQVVHEQFTEAQVTAGRSLYAQWCGRCHGIGTMSAGVLPDLRRSAALPDAKLWHSIVLGGILEPAGMISFSQWLKPKDIEEIRAYVADRAKRAAAQPN